jgi:hypothetical protein
MAPMFVLTALLHAAAVASRFDVLHAMLPAAVHAAALWVHFPLLLISGYYESRLDYGPAMTGFPLWMQIRSGPVKWSLTLAFTYLAIVTVQTFDWSFGPLDPTPPLVWPPLQRALWFFGFSFGMYFANYLATTKFVVPVLRGIAKPMRWLPTPVAVLVLALLGLGLGYLALQALTLADSLRSDPTTVVAIVAAALLAPLLLASLARKTTD